MTAVASNGGSSGGSKYSNRMFNMTHWRELQWRCCAYHWAAESRGNSGSSGRSGGSAVVVTVAAGVAVVAVAGSSYSSAAHVLEPENRNIPD